MLEDINTFRNIVEKYGFSDEQKAEEITNFITDPKNQGFTVKEFSVLFNMKVEDAKIFLDILQKGVHLKEKYIPKDNNSSKKE